MSAQYFRVFAPLGLQFVILVEQNIDLFLQCSNVFVLLLHENKLHSIQSINKSSDQTIWNVLWHTQFDIDTSHDAECPESILSDSEPWNVLQAAGH